MDTCKSTQKVLNKALRTLARVRARSTRCSAEAIAAEMGVPSIHAVTAAARARLYAKAPSSRTLLRRLARSHATYGRLSALGRTSRMLIRLLGPNWAGSPTVLARKVRGAQSAKELAAGKTNCLMSWRASHFRAATVSYARTALYVPELAAGYSYLTKWRVRAVWLAPALASVRMIGLEWKDRCPCCEAEVSETREHFWLACVKWAGQRQRYLRKLIDYYASLCPDLSPVARDIFTVTALLGGGIAGDNPGLLGPAGEVRSRVLKTWSRARRANRTDLADRLPSANLDPRIRALLGGGARSRWGSHMFAPLSVWVALFLDEVWPLRLQIVSPIINSYEPMPLPVGQPEGEQGAAGT